MFDWVSFLYRRSQLAASFATRLKALQALKDPFALKGIPLMRGNGEPFKIEPYRGLPRPQGMFANMCRVTDGPAVGTLLKLARGHLLFVGVQRKVFEMAASQDFEAILDYRDPGGTIPKQLHCVIPRGRAQTMGILEFDDESQSDSPYIHFDASGLLHYSEGAMVFGIVTPRRTSRTYR